MDYKYNRRFFSFINWISTSLMIVVGLISLYFYLLIGMIILLAIGSYIFYKYYDKPVEADIDIVFEKQAHIAIQRGYEKLGLQSQSTEMALMDPIVIQGPFLGKISFDPMVFKGKDQQVRSSNHQVIVFYFSNKQVYYYQCNFSVIDDEMNETVGEIFYQDIVSVATSSTTTLYFDSRKKQERFFNLDIFELTTSGGMSIQCPVKDYKTTEQSISAMKDLLREKKSAS